MVSRLLKANHAYTFDDLLILPGRTSVEPSQVKIDSKFSRNIPLSIPIVSSPMDTVTDWRMATKLAQHGALGVIHRNMSKDEQASHVMKVKEHDTLDISNTDEEGKLRVAAAVGPFDLDRAKLLNSVGADAIVLDAAHAHNENVIKSAKKLRREISCDLVVGNIATSKAALDYLDAEPDAFRVGLGSGSICTTRVVTGVGVPQASAVEYVYRVAKKERVPVVCDGGIRYYGDVVKALALGADSVMVGRMVAGCEESPSPVIDGSEYGLRGKYKVYRGMASKTILTSTDRYVASSKGIPEGVESLVPLTGPIRKVLEEVAWGLKQGMGYIGATNIKELRKKAKFIIVTQSSVAESKPHDVYVIDSLKPV